MTPSSAWRIAAGCVLAIATTTPAAAQMDDGMPTEYMLQVAPGGFVDLDTGLVLPGRTFRTFLADLVFGRDGGGLYFEPLHGGAQVMGDPQSPPAELSTERVRIGRQQDAPLVMFAKTDRGFARVELMVADPYSTGSASLRWVVVPPKNPVFLPAPTDLDANWVGGKLQVEWSGDYPRWLVEQKSGDAVRKVTCEEPRALLADLDPRATHRIVVRGLSASGDVSLPADIVRVGSRQVPVVGAVDFAKAWYDRSGGLSVTRGEVALADAEVVFYLYGVYVPGGWVTKIGTGSAAFEARHRLPAGPFPPVYGRIDEGDVLVVRLADGRYAKLWLDSPHGDVRNGMRVHFVFLPDGRRTLLAPPAALQAERTEKGPRVTWQPSTGAVRYRVSVAGQPSVETADTTVVLSGLPADRVLECAVVAIGADGEVSGAGKQVVLTYGPNVKHGTGTIDAAMRGGGFDFAGGQAVAHPGDVAITSAAGGASYLCFAGAAVAPGGAFAFGEFPPASSLQFGERVESDDRNAGSERFYVRTADGGIASVRIVQRTYPKVAIEYVWVPKR